MNTEYHQKNLVLIFVDSALSVLIDYIPEKYKVKKEKSYSNRAKKLGRLLVLPVALKMHMINYLLYFRYNF